MRDIKANLVTGFDDFSGMIARYYSARPALLSGSSPLPWTRAMDTTDFGNLRRSPESVND